MMSNQLREYKERTDMREWRLNYSVMGMPVCKASFLRVTGIGANSLTRARQGAVMGLASSLSRQELGVSRLIRSTNKHPLYLDARQWLEHYADTHGEHSPMDCLTFLPAGKKQFYYAQYASARAKQGSKPASLSTYLEAWRVDVSWLVVSRTICKFSKCGVCEYLKWLIDQTPRTNQDVMQMYLGRLGHHFDFQSAQRLAIARVEEICTQSNNTKWLMLIDKMDQNAAKLPTEWRLMRAAFFKEGERLQMSLNGAWFFGPQKSPEVLIRTMYEDFQHGANMQASTLLMNFHNRAMQEGTIPEEWFINPDNTPKETKNTICANFIIWLLLNMEGSPLWCVTFLYQIVGHTHNKLDRGFGLIKNALQGQTYYSKETLQDIVKTRVRGISIDFAHLDNVWDWKPMEAQCNLPHIKYIHRTHALCLFRAGGCILAKWKQYITSPDWSRSVVIVPAHLAKRIADWRPPRIPNQFDPKFVTSHLTWLNKLGVAQAETPGDKTRNIYLFVFVFYFYMFIEVFKHIIF